MSGTRRRIAFMLVVAISLSLRASVGQSQSAACDLVTPSAANAVLDVSVTRLATGYQYVYSIRNPTESSGCVYAADLDTWSTVPVPAAQVMLGTHVYRFDRFPTLKLVPGLYSAAPLTQCLAGLGGLGLGWGCAEGIVEPVVDPLKPEMTPAITVEPGQTLQVFSIESPAPPGARRYILEPMFGEAMGDWPRRDLLAQVRALTVGPTDPADLVFFLGGGEDPSIDEALAYSHPVANVTSLRKSEVNFPLAIRYGATIQPATFTATLNGIDITSSFHPVAGDIEAVTLPLAPGSASLVLSVDEGNAGQTATDTDTLVFLVGDQMPLAVPDAVVGAEDGSVTSDVLANDAGIGETPLSLTITTPPTNGTASVNADRTVTYTPVANFAGPDAYSYVVADEDGDASTAAVTVTVSPVNDPPAAQGEFVPAPPRGSD